MDFLEDKKLIDKGKYQATNKIAITPLEIVMKMKTKDNSFLQDGKTTNSTTHNANKNNEKISLNNPVDVYKEFFHLTLLSHKLNSMDFEPFNNVNKHL